MPGCSSAIAALVVRKKDLKLFVVDPGEELRGHAASSR